MSPVELADWLRAASASATGECLERYYEIECCLREYALMENRIVFLEACVVVAREERDRCWSDAIESIQREMAQLRKLKGLKA